jgi:hypothetical protein
MKMQGKECGTIGPLLVVLLSVLLVLCAETSNIFKLVCVR